MYVCPYYILNLLASVSIPTAARSAATVLDPSEAAFVR